MHTDRDEILRNTEERDTRTGFEDKELDYIPLWMRYEAILGRISNEALGELVRAMFSYAKDGGTPELQGEGYFLWPLIRQDMDYSRKSYEKKVAAGRRSGESRKTKKQETKLAEMGNAPEQEGTETNTPEQERTETNKPEQKRTEGSNPEHKAVNQYHNQKQNQVQKQNHSSAAKAAPERAAADAKKAGNDLALGEQVVSLFYQERDDLKRPAFIPEQTLRRAAVVGRKYPMEAVRTVFHKSREGFLNGAGNKGWTATLSWLLEDQHFRDILEGKYDKVHTAKGEARAGAKPETLAQSMTRRVELGSAGLGEYERQAIRRMLAENDIS